MHFALHPTDSMIIIRILDARSGSDLREDSTVFGHLFPLDQTKFWFRLPAHSRWFLFCSKCGK